MIDSVIHGRQVWI